MKENQNLYLNGNQHPWQLIIDKRFWKKEEGWKGYEKREEGSVYAASLGVRLILNMHESEKTYPVTPQLLRKIHLTVSAEVAGGYHISDVFDFYDGPSESAALAGNFRKHKSPCGFPIDYTVHFNHKYDDTILDYFSKQILEQAHIQSLKDKEGNLPIKTNIKQMKNKPVLLYIISNSNDVESQINAAFDTYNHRIKECKSDREKLITILTLVQTIEFIHPFGDGNCRTVYCLLQYLLLENGLPFAILNDPNCFDFLPVVSEEVHSLVDEVEKAQAELNESLKLAADFPLVTRDKFKWLSELQLPNDIQLSQYTWEWLEGYRLFLKSLDTRSNSEEAFLAQIEAELKNTSPPYSPNEYAKNYESRILNRIDSSKSNHEDSRYRWELALGLSKSWEAYEKEAPGTIYSTCLGLRLINNMFLSDQHYVPSAHLLLKLHLIMARQEMFQETLIFGNGCFRNSKVDIEIDAIFAKYNSNIGKASSPNEKLDVISTLTQEILSVKPFTNRNESTICCLLQYLLLENNLAPVVMSDLIKDFSAKDISASIKRGQLNYQERYSIVSTDLLPDIDRLCQQGFNESDTQAYVERINDIDQLYLKSMQVATKKISYSCKQKANQMKKEATSMRIDNERMCTNADELRAVSSSYASQISEINNFLYNNIGKAIFFTTSDPLKWLTDPKLSNAAIEQCPKGFMDQLCALLEANNENPAFINQVAIAYGKTVSDQSTVSLFAETKDQKATLNINYKELKK
jgi:hypothetical protein